MTLAQGRGAPAPRKLRPRRAPERVATDDRSQLYVCDPQAGQVVVLDAFGRLVLARTGLGQPLGIAVDNAAGAVTSSPATLTIILYPVITEPPADQIAAVGATVVFNLTAVGTAPLSYQWSRNGVALSGQTRSQLVLSSVTSAQNGTYSVRVSNTGDARPLATATAGTAALRWQHPDAPPRFLIGHGSC